MWLTHTTRKLITPCSQSKLSSWKLSRLSPAHRAHHKEIVTYYNSPKAQHPRTNFWKQPGKPGQHFTSIGNTRVRATLIRHILSLSLSPTSPLLSFSHKMEELVCAGTKLSHSKKRRAPQPPKIAGPALAPPPVRVLRPLPGPKPSSIGCR